MKTLSKHILILLIGLFTTTLIAQKARIQTVQDDYKDGAYIKTSEVLLKVANKGFRSKKLLEQLSNSLYFSNRMEEAAKWYGELMKLDEVIEPEYYFRYALALRGIEDYEGSDKWMEKFNELKPNDLRGRAFASKVDYRAAIEDESRDDIDLINLDFNSELSDFGTAEYKNYLVFASSRGGGKKYRRNEQPFLDLFTVDKNDDGTYGEIKSLSESVNSKFHESSAAFTSNRKYLFFTSNNYINKKYKEDDEGVNRLQLYRATLGDDGSWGDVYSVHFNSPDYSVAHPTVNLQGTKLYFASDMPGTIGQSDIWVVNIKDNGSLGNPLNMGKSINTEGQESFPFVNTSGDFYFSSNGYPGLGGFDVFLSDQLDKRITMSSNQKFIIKNVGKPVNSPSDDFAYYENLVTKQVYFSSNRPGGKGSDDIYTFMIPECEQTLDGIVKDIDTDELMPFATVVIFDNKGNEIDRKTTDADAAFSFKLKCEMEYLIRGEKEAYTADEKRFKTPQKKQKLELQLLLDKDEQEIVAGTDLAKVLDIPIIYFDFDKSDIRYDASLELEKVLAVMEQYPSLNINIKSHTDSKGPAAYNERLSDKRAKSTRQYLIDKGISPDRLTAKGYGESELLNECADGIECTPEQQQLNRRSEFIIITM